MQFVNGIHGRFSTRFVLAVGMVLLGTAMVAKVTGGETSSSASGSDVREIEGSLVIIGGSARYDNEPIWSEIVRLAGGPKRKIAVFPCASSNPELSGKLAVEQLQKRDIDAFVVPVYVSGSADPTSYKRATRDPQLVQAVRDCQGVYFTGGSQARIREALVEEDGQHTPLLDAVWDVYRRGGVVAGTSAGAAIMSRVMFRDAGVVLNTMLHGVKMGKELDRGLGFLDPAWFVDQHCLVRGRFARALVAMHHQKLPFGIGVDEDTAVVVEQQKFARVVGSRGAVVLDLSQAKSAEDIEDFNLRNVRLSFLDNGDVVNLKSLAVTPAPVRVAQRKIDPSAPDFRPAIRRRLFYADMLGNSTLVEVMRRVLFHQDGLATGLAFDGLAAQEGSTTGFEFRFYRGEDTCGWEGEANGLTQNTIQNIHLDIKPVTVKGPLYVDAKVQP